MPGAAADAAPVTHVPVDLAADAVVGAIAGALANSWKLDGRAGQSRTSSRALASSRPDRAAPPKAAAAPVPVRSGDAHARAGAMVASRAKRRLRRG